MTVSLRRGASLTAATTAALVLAAAPARAVNTYTVPAGPYITDEVVFSAPTMHPDASGSITAMPVWFEIVNPATASGPLNVTEVRMALPSGAQLTPGQPLPDGCGADTSATIMTCTGTPSIAAGDRLDVPGILVSATSAAPGQYRDGSITVTAADGSTLTAPLEGYRLGPCLYSPSTVGLHEALKLTKYVDTNTTCDNIDGGTPETFGFGLFDPSPGGADDIQSTVGNPGGAATATNGTLTVALPPGMSADPLGQNPDCVPAPSGETVTCTIGGLTAAQQVTYSIKAHTVDPAALPTRPEATLTYSSAGIGQTAQTTFALNGTDFPNDAL